MEILAFVPTESKPMPDPEALRVEAALEAQEIERAEAIAMLLANFNGIYDLKAEPEQTRQHFAQWGLIAVRGAHLGARQFRTVALAAHAAAQALHNAEAGLEGFTSLDLLAPHNGYERQHCTIRASRAVEEYKKVLGGTSTKEAWERFAGRLGLQK